MHQFASAADRDRKPTRAIARIAAPLSLAEAARTPKPRSPRDCTRPTQSADSFPSLPFFYHLGSKSLILRDLADVYPCPGGLTQPVSGRVLATTDRRTIVLRISRTIFATVEVGWVAENSCQ